MVDQPSSIRPLRTLPPATKKGRPPQVDILTRRKQALDLWYAGASEEDIGLILAADPSINVNGAAVPGGYGWQSYYAGKPPVQRDTLRAQVVKDVQTAMDTIAAQETQTSERLFTAEMQSLRRLKTAMWGPAMNGSHMHAFRVIQISERLSKMMGWDSERRMVDSTSTVTATVDVAALGISATPSYDPDWLGKFGAALLQGKLVPEAVVDNALTAIVVHDDVIDVEAIEVGSDDTPDE